MNRQSDLEQWAAGFFDGDGSIQPHISKASDHNAGYSITPTCRIKHTYVSGLFDAEGSVAVEIRKQETSRIDYTAFPRCGISQSGEHSPILERLKEFCGSINIEYSVQHYEYDDDNKNSYFDFRIQHRDHVRQFLEVLKPYLVVKKEQANIMLTEILPMLSANKHHTKRGFLNVMRSVDKMNSLKGGTRGKYNYEYFSEKWNLSTD